MREFIVDFSKEVGNIKPMNAVNNGPTSKGVRGAPSSFEKYAEANIPFARNHDASFFIGYGGDHTVDVHRIFRNFDADENDPANYIFEPTDEYVKITYDAGTKVFYRLGAAIEHGYKYGTYPPKDFEKWARICEHIIRHYNEGWANGFEYGIEYWEIWNEPDCRNRTGENPCWQGTNEEFAEFFTVAFNYLKSKFPSLKIGGPAICSVWSPNALEILEEMKKREVKPDFFSYHWYGDKIEKIEQTFARAKELADDAFYPGIELILNEWNYIRGWHADDWNYSLETEKNLKGSAFVAAVMSAAQKAPLDMLMYYDARPCGMNGLFAAATYEPLKPYYVFKAFAHLYALGTEVESKSEGGIYTLAAKNDSEAAILVTSFIDTDEINTEDVKLSFEGLFSGSPIKAEYYLLDEKNDLDLVREEIFTADKFSAYIKMPMFTTYFIKLSKV